MKTSKQLELGFRTYFDAIGFIFSRGLWWAFFIPLAMNILLFAGGYAFVDSITAEVQNRVIAFIGLNNADFLVSDFLRELTRNIIGFLLKVAFFFLFMYLGGYISLMMLSPLLAYLSERTEEIILGKKHPFDPGQWLHDIIRSIIISFRNLFIQTGWMLLILFMGIIPVIGWIGMIVFFMISAYFYGFSFLDYVCERNRLNISDSVRLIRSNKWLAMANGTIFSLFLFLPYVGVFLSGFAAIVSVVAATLAFHEMVLNKKM